MLIKSTLVLSAVIVLVPKHLPFLGDCLEDVRNQTLSFDECIIVASGFRRSDTKALEDLVRTFANSNLRILRAKKAPAGFNRNLGGHAARGDVLFFLDADDRYHRQRNKIVLDSMRHSGASLVSNSFITFEQESDKTLKDWANTHMGHAALEGEIISAEGIWGADTRHRRRDKEMLGAYSQVKPSEGTMHHGHLVITRENFLSGTKYHEYYFPRNEDSVFIRDKIEEGCSLLFLNTPLSAYRTTSSSAKNKLDFPGMAIMRVGVAVLVRQILRIQK